MNTDMIFWLVDKADGYARGTLKGDLIIWPLLLQWAIEGIKEKHIKLTDGLLYDEIIYELHRDDYLSGKIYDNS